MSIKHKTETPNSVYGPATGVSEPERKNQVLSTGDEHERHGDVTPGTSTIQYPGHQPGGPGHEDCDHD